MSRKALVPIELPADPATAMEAVTKQYADKMNEVHVGTTDPGAGIDLWYDSDAPAAVVIDTQPGPWTTLTLAAAWVWYGTGYQTPQYRIDRGTVELRGFVKPASPISATSTIATGLLNPPPATNLFAGIQHPGPTGWHSPARLDVTNAGALVYTWLAGQSSPSWVSLSQVRWSA